MFQRLIFAKLRNFFGDEEGATAIEYAVVAALIAAVCVASVAQLATATNDSLTDSVTAINAN